MSIDYLEKCITVKSRIRKLVKAYPAECQIVVENKDESLCVHLPTAWIRINPGRELSEEQRGKLRLNVQKARQALNENR